MLNTVVLLVRTAPLTMQSMMRGGTKLVKGCLLYYVLLLLVAAGERHFVLSFASTETPLRRHIRKQQPTRDFDDSRRRSCCSTRFFVVPNKNDDERKNEWQGYPTQYHFILSDRVILPGETVSLVLSDEESIPLLQNCLESTTKSSGSSLVVGVNLLEKISEMTNADAAAEDSWRMAQIASHCDIIGLTVRGGGGGDDETSYETISTTTASGNQNNSHVSGQQEQVVIDLACTGRVRVLELLEQYSDRSYRCDVEPIDETIHDEEEFIRAKMLEENIRMLLKKASKMELEIRNNHQKEEQRQKKPTTTLVAATTSSTISDGNDIYLYSNYIRTKARVWRIIGRDVQRQHILPYMKIRNVMPTNISPTDEVELSESYCEDIQSLFATSWAAFLSLRDNTLDARYRLRALDWDNLYERLKLAQYALREKELFLQGQLMAMESGADDIIAEGVSTVAGTNDDDLGVFQ